MHVVGCPLADAVVARMDSIRRRVAMLFSEDESSEASTCNRIDLRRTGREDTKVYQ